MSALNSAPDPLSLRPNRVEVDVDAVVGNLTAIRRALRPGTKIFAALKANGYGFGLELMADCLVGAGVDGIAVADPADAIDLRRRGHRLPILLYPGHWPDRDVVARVEAHDLMPTFCDWPEAEVYSRWTRRSIRVFVKIDVGLERLGAPAETAVALIEGLRGFPRLEIHGLYTHAHVPRDVSLDFLNWQVGRFQAVVDALAQQGIVVPIKMLASSGILRQQTGVDYDAVDPGHLLVGLSAGPEARIVYDTRSALHAVRSRLIQVKLAGSNPFPDQAPFPLRPGLRFGVLPLGLRDGIQRFNAGSVLVRGRRAPILGRPSLEHTRVDISAIDGAAAGDEATIIGSQDGATISIEEVMRHSGHPRAIDVLMAIAPSIPRTQAPGRKAAPDTD